MQVISSKAIPTGPLQTGTMRLISKNPIQITTTILMAVALLQVIAIATAQPMSLIGPGTLKPSEIASPVAPVETQPQQATPLTNTGSPQQVVGAMEAATALQNTNDSSQVPSTKHANTAEKIKRGLINFLNQADDPGLLFVPAPADSQQQNHSPPNSPAANTNQARTSETHVNNKARSFVSSVPPRWGRR